MVLKVQLQLLPNSSNALCCHFTLLVGRLKWNQACEKTPAIVPPLGFPVKVFGDPARLLLSMNTLSR